MTYQVTLHSLIFLILETVAANRERGLFFLEAYFFPLIEIHMWHNYLLLSLVEILIKICDTVNLVFLRIVNGLKFSLEG